MYTVCGVKRSEEKASHTLFLAEWGDEGFFLVAVMEVSALRRYRRRRRSCLPLGGHPLITAARVQAPALGAPELPKRLATRSKGPRGEGTASGVPCPGALRKRSDPAPGAQGQPAALLTPGPGRDGGRGSHFTDRRTSPGE